MFATSLIDAPLEPVNQDVVVDPVEELRQVHVHHHALARLNVRPRGLDRIVRTPPGTEPVAVVAEGGVDQRLQHLAFEDKYLQTVVGTVVRINQRTATIDPGDGTTWRVGFALLRPVVDV
jgi:hypothetical protein